MRPEKAMEQIVHGRGYVVLRDHFAPGPALEVVRDYVDRSVKDGVETFSGGYRPGSVILEKVVQDLMTDPLLLAIGQACIGSRPAFGSLGANCVPAGSEGMDAHVDYPYFAMGVGPANSGLPMGPFPALCVQLIWYLVDVEDGDGGETLVVPWSQMSPSFPRSSFRGRAERVTARAGDVFVGHGALWHGVAPKESGPTRHALLGSYVPFWVSPMLRPDTSFASSQEMAVLLRSDLGDRIGEGYLRTIEEARES